MAESEPKEQVKTTSEDTTNQSDEKKNLLLNRRIQYPTCPKDGFCYGEVANMIVLDNAFKLNNLVCCSCVENTHAERKVRPIKVILDEAYSRIAKISKSVIDTDALIELIEKNEKAIMEDLAKATNAILEKQKEITEQYTQYFKILRQSVTAKSQSSDEVAGIIEKIFTDEQSFDDLQTNMNKIMDFASIGAENEDFNPVDTQEIQDSIEDSCQELMKQTQKFQTDCEELYNKQSQYITDLIASNSSFSSALKFQFGDIKHTNVQIVTSTHAKSIGNSSGYKFAVLEPSLDSKGTKKRTFAYKMHVVNSSNWIAIGICHKNIIKAKNFTFSFSTLGHGAYMISSNGGTWSNHQSQFNNSVKAFKFTKGDTVIVTYDPNNSVLHFQKEKTNETYKLEIKKIEGDPFYPCCLFYYQSDEIQFLNNYKSE